MTCLVLQKEIAARMIEAYDWGVQIVPAGSSNLHPCRNAAAASSKTEHAQPSPSFHLRDFMNCKKVLKFAPERGGFSGPFVVSSMQACQVYSAGWLSHAHRGQSCLEVSRSAGAVLTAGAATGTGSGFLQTLFSLESHSWRAKTSTSFVRSSTFSLVAAS